MNDVRIGGITAQTRRRWAVKAAVLAVVVLVLTPVLAVAADAVMEVPIEGLTASGVLASFFVLALGVLVVANLVWAAGGERAPRARWLPWLAVAVAGLGLVVAALGYDADVDGAAPFMVLAVSGLAFVAVVAQSLRIARAPSPDRA